MKSTKAADELIRVRHAMDRLKAQLQSLEIVVSEAETLEIPCGAEATQALFSTTLEIVTGLAKVDAYFRAQTAE